MTQSPNILWIVTDHQIHGSAPVGFSRFPLQQKLRALGTEFTRAYSALPICSPARASMLTGLYPHAHGLTENDGRFGGRENLDPSDWMIQQPLLDAGYRCGWFGKWHVDNLRSANDYGFEGFSLPGYGYPYGTAEYRQYLEQKSLSPPVVDILMPGESGLEVGHRVALCDQTHWFDYEAGVALFDGPVEAHESYFLVNQATQWLEGLQDEPFMLRLDTWGPHPPYLLGSPFANALSRESIELPKNFTSDLAHRPSHHRGYRDQWQQTLGFNNQLWHKLYLHGLEHVIQVETALCELLEHIDLDNTLVIFNSDHGDAVGSNGGVANKGGLMVEATMQIPLLMAGAGVTAGKTCHQLVSQVDLAPTLMEMAGFKENQKMHGQSLLPLVDGRNPQWRSGLLAQHYGLHERLPQRAWYQENMKLVLQQDGFAELYDLRKDPDELRNLANEESWQSSCHQMQLAMTEAMSAINDRLDETT